MLTARVTVLVGPGGYGKTSLAEELAEHVEGRLLRFTVPQGADEDRLVALVHRTTIAHGLSLGDPAALDDLAETGRRLVRSMADHPPTVVLVDDCHASPVVAGRLVEALGDLASQHRLVAAGRRPPDVDAGDALVLSYEELAFTPEESARLLGGPSAQWFAEAVHGWPLAVAFGAATALPRIGAAPFDAERILDELVERFLADCDGHVQALLGRVAHLPVLRPGLVDAVAGRGAWDTLLNSGLPLVARAGSLVLSEPIRERLAARYALGEATARTIATGLAAEGRTADAVDVLVRTGAAVDAANLLAGMPLHELEQLSAVELRALASVIASRAGSPDPRVQLQLARLCDVEARIVERQAILRHLAGAEGPALLESPQGRAVAAEQVRDLVRQSDVDGALQRALEVLRACDGSEAVTRARTLSAVGLAEAFGQRPGWVHRAADALVEAATLARSVGERHMAAESMMWLGYWVQLAAGLVDPALESLRAALDAAVPGSRRRGVAAAFLGDGFVRVGRADEAEAALDEARRIGRSRCDSLTLAYDAWLRAEAATVRGDEAAVALLLDEVEQHRTDWWDHSTGADFLAAAAEMWRRVGRPARAAEVLERATGHVEGTMPTVRLAAAMLEAEHGDARRGAELLDELLDRDALFATDRLRALAVRAVAARRAGDPQAGLALDRLVRAEQDLRLPGLTTLLEPHAAVVLGLAPATPPHDGTDGRVEVRLLGGFAILRDGCELEPPPPMIGKLVKHLALAGGPVPVEEAMEMLWPAEHPETARRRLRNTMNRLRTTVPVPLVERLDHVLRLRTDVDVDVRRFFLCAERALGADGENGIRWCREALSLHDSGLLPEDRYDDSFSAPRERVGARRVQLLEHLAHLGAAAGRSDVVVAARAELVDVEPFEESRYVDLARAALDAQLLDRARDVVARARQVAADLGVQPSTALRAMSATLDSRFARMPGARTSG
jgi:DNA-binding SARP family transcriptional activator